MDWSAWWGVVHGVAKSQTRLSDFPFTFHFHALEKEMATHSSILAWRAPGTGDWWAAIYGVAQSGAQLKRLSSSSSIGLPRWLSWYESTCNVGDLGSITGLGRSPGEGKGYPLRYSGLENSMDAIVHRVAKSRTRLSNFHFRFICTRPLIHNSQ